MAKWTLIDTHQPIRTLTGRLKKAYLYDLDGDLNFQLVPLPACEDLLCHKGVPNADGRVECEIETLDRHEDQVLRAFWPALKEKEFTVIGPWVNDDPHGHKTEIHAIDVMYTLLRGAHIPAWTNGFKKKYPGTKLFVHRVFAGADQSDKNHPPLSDRTRTTVIELPLPPKPADTAKHTWQPDFEPHIAIREHTEYTFTLLPAAAPPALRFEVTPRAYKKGEPGLILFDVVTYWKTILK